MTAVQFALDSRYHLDMITIRTHRRPYHYFRSYVLADFDPAVLAAARAEIGDTGLRHIAAWLHLSPTTLITLAKGGAA